MSIVIGNYKGFGSDVIRLMFFLLMAGFFTIGTTGCDSIENEDASSGGSASTTAGGTAAATTSATTTNSADNKTEATAPATPAPETNKNLPELSETGIVWKPVSENDHKLVVLIPRNYGNVSVAVLNAQDELIDEGRFVGRTNGDRPTYRFSRAGRDYPTPSHLRVGSSIFNVSSPASRYN